MKVRDNDRQFSALTNTKKNEFHINHPFTKDKPVSMDPKLLNCKWKQDLPGDVVLPRRHVGPTIFLQPNISLSGEEARIVAWDSQLSP